ncbi:MAG: hypothetical protein JNK14_15630 [Chitinophagaceae bacterium]|nr:hypothetical protein [Chitinophagaceae bacterium]
MRKLYLIFLFFSFQTVFCQDQGKIKAIDSLVSRINSSDLGTATDTVINDMPAMGLYMKTLVSVTIQDSGVVKYRNDVFGITDRGGRRDTLHVITTFYFVNGKLAKVEDYGIAEGGRSVKADWYYYNDQPLYYNAGEIKGEKAELRSKQLLFMAGMMQEQFRKRLPGNSR